MAQKNLEKIVEDQAKMIDDLRKVVATLHRQLVAVSKKTDRAYENCRRNTNDISTINRNIRSNR